MSESARTNDDWRPIAALSAAILLFVWTKLAGVEYARADDNIYHYLALRWSEGAVPYRDFFHAHPPLHLLPGAAAYWLAGGFSLTLARLIPLAAAATAGWLLYRAARRIGPVEGVLTFIVFLFAFDPLRISTHFVGANLSAMWIALALERISAERYGQAGVATALSSLTLLNAVPAGIGFGLVLLLLRPRAAISYALAGLVVFAIGNGLAISISGEAYIDQVLLYHLGKSTMPSGSATIYWAVIGFNPWLTYGALSGLVALFFVYNDHAATETNGNEEPGLRAYAESKRVLVVAIGGALGSMIFLATIARVFNYYFEVFYVCLAPLAGFALAESGRRFARAGRERALVPALEALGLVGILMFGVGPRWQLDSEELTHPLSPKAWSRHLWPSSASFPGSLELADEVARGIGHEGTVFGDSTTAPLVALLAKRRISFDLADTNPMRFESGTLEVDDLIALLEREPPSAIVSDEERWLLDQEKLQHWLERTYTPSHWVDDPSGTHVLWLPR
jgi:hypothetical protein